MALPLIQAALYAAVAQPAWLSVGAVAGGLLLRAAVGRTAVVVVALLLAPVWQPLMHVTGVPADFTQIVPWLGLLGAGLAWPGQGYWQVDAPWSTATLAWAMVLSLVAPVVIARELDFVWSAAPWANAAHAVTLAALAQLVALLLFEWYWGAAGSARSAAWRALLPGTLAAGGLAIWQQFIDPTLLTTPLWAGLRRSSGTFFDANATAALLALAIPILASALVRPSRIPPWLWAVPVLGLGFVAILATGSRSALVAFALIVATRVVLAGRAWRWAVVAVALVVSGAVLRTTAAVPDAATGHAVGRLADTVRTVLASGPAGLRSILWDRDGYGPTAMAMIADHPWAGIGPGLFGQGVMGYSREAAGRTLPPDNAQNWWRHQVAELGVPGAAPALVCSGLALLALLRRRSDAVAPLTGLGLLAFVSPPMAHPIIQVIVGLVVAEAVAPSAGAPGAPAHQRGLPAFWVLVPGGVAALCVIGADGLRPPLRAARFGTLYSYGVTGIQSTPYGDGRWMATRAVAVLQPTGAMLVARVVIPHDDAALRPVQVTIATRDGVACRYEAVDATPFECRMTAPTTGWAMVQVDVSRAWREHDGMTQAAFVSARFEP